MGNEKKYFYCYSVKMKDFIKSMGLRYIDSGNNINTQKPYFMFEKSTRLDSIIKAWNSIKR